MDLETQIRQAIHAARQSGRPAPGRPTLVKLTGATDHAVKRVLATLATERDHQTSPVLPDTSTIGAGEPNHAPLTLVATHPGEGPHDRRRSTGELANDTTLTGERHTSPSASLASSSASPGDHHQPHRGGGQATSGRGTADQQPTPAGGRLVAWTGFLFGSITSIAANVLHVWLPTVHQAPGWTPGLAPQLGAAVWPIGLMLAVEAVSRIRWPAGIGWALARFGGAGTVALGSAVISYGHLRAVLVAWHYSPLAADVGPLVLDGLMIVCGFALLANSLTNRDLGRCDPATTASNDAN